MPKLDLVDVSERLFKKNLNMKKGIFLHLLDHGWAFGGWKGVKQT